MQYACMPVNITIRDVPDAVRDELSVRAAAEGKSMQEYLRGELVRISESASVADWLKSVRERKAVYNTRLTADRITEARDQDRK